MTAPRYPDAAIDRAIRETMAFACYHATAPSKAKVAKVRAEMIRIRDAAGPRMGALPSPEDLTLALGLRARDLLGLSPESGFYLDAAARGKVA